MRLARLRDSLFLAMVGIFTLGYATVPQTLLLITALGEGVKRSWRWEPSALDRPLLALVIAAFVSVLFSGWRLISLLFSVVLLLVILVTVRSTLAYVQGSVDRVWRLLVVWVGGGVVAAASALARADPTGGLRPRTPGLAANDLGATLAVALTLAVGLLLSAGIRRRGLAAMAAGVLLGGLVLTFSRASWLGAVAGLATLLLVGRPRARLVLGAAAIAIVVVALIVAPRWPPLLKEMRSITSLEANRNRLAIWTTAVRITADHPLFGAGFRAFWPAYVRYRPPDAPDPYSWHAHNIILTFAAETGLLGLAAFLALCAAALRAMWRWWRRSPLESRSRDAAACVLAATVAFLTNQLFDLPSMVPDIGIGLFLLFALGAAGERELAGGGPRGGGDG